MCGEIPGFKNSFLLLEIKGKKDDLIPKANLKNMTVRKRIKNVRVLAIAT